MAPSNGIVTSPAGTSKRTASVLSPSPQNTATTNNNSIILPHDIPSSPNKRAKCTDSSGLAGAMVTAMDYCGISSKEKMEEYVVGLLEQIRKAPNNSNAEQMLAYVGNGPNNSSKNRTGNDTNNSTSGAVLVDMTAQVENVPPSAKNAAPAARNLGGSLAAEASTNRKASINRKAFEVKLFPDGSLIEREYHAGAQEKMRAINDMDIQNQSML